MESVTSILHFICDRGGAVQLSELSSGYFFSTLATKVFLAEYRQYFVLGQHESRNEVRAFTPVTLCDEFDSKSHNCPLLFCGKLHLCKHHVTGHCSYGLRCKSNHNIHTAHNQQVLETNQLDALDDDVIMKLLKVSCVEYTIPGVCTFYNTIQGCRNAHKCTFLHVCSYFINENCKFATGCRRSHNIYDMQPRNVLDKFGIDITQSPTNVLRILRNKRRVETGRDIDGNLDAATSAICAMPPFKSNFAPFSGLPGTPRRMSTPSTTPPINRCQSPLPRYGSTPPITTPTFKRQISAPTPLVRRSQTSDVGNQDKYICIFNLSGKCQYEERCFNLHTDEPFRWQFQDGGWKDFDKDDNIQIEKTFCNPMRNKAPTISTQPAQRSKFLSRIGTGEVDFTSMKVTMFTADYNIRRVSTNVENQGWKQSFSTKWLWYWKDNDGKYVEYGKQSEEGTSAAIDSSTLEEAYTQFLEGNHEGKVQFRTGKFTYEICFKDMKQRNIATTKVRKLKHRPVFACKADVIQRAKRFKDLPSNTAVPDTWDLTIISSDTGFRLCKLSSSSSEYREVERKFTTTMPTLVAFLTVRVISIKRVQNVELWDDFSRKQTKMEKRNGNGKIKPELLFHGTTDNVISAICQQGFDHRLSGTRVGAKYGQGSYFHKSASYSHEYAKRDSSGHKHMFLSRVLVGSYARGMPDHRRPPPKDPRRPLEDFHDTCVDSVIDPSIFVVFDNHQAYPEYIITYR